MTDSLIADECIPVIELVGEVAIATFGDVSCMTHHQRNEVRCDLAGGAVDNVDCGPEDAHGA